VSEIVSGKGQKNAQSQLVTGLARFCMAALISAIFFLSDQIAHVRKLVLIVSPAASEKPSRIDEKGLNCAGGIPVHLRKL
jgi:hypothetical protein